MSSTHFLVTIQGNCRTMLDEGVHANGCVLAYLQYGFGQFFRSHGPAKAPAVHGIGLGETIDDDGAFCHAGNGVDAWSYRTPLPW
jgi:hypothetical protein